MSNVTFEENEFGEQVKVTVTPGGVIRELYRPIPDAPSENWRITVGAFFNRFGDDTIPLLASSDATIQAWVKLAMVQEYITLNSAKTEQGIDFLKTKPGFNINKDAILTTPPTDGERFKG